MELSGGEIGILLLPGYEASPIPATEWAHALHKSGFTVFLPRAPRRRKSREKFSRSQWQERYRVAEEELKKLRSHCQKVFLVAIDSGGAQAALLCETFGEEIDGAILLDPVLPRHRFLFAKFWRKAENDLALISQPVLLIYSIADGENKFDSSFFISHEISSPFIREVLLQDSGSGSISSSDALIVVEESLAFISEISSGSFLNDMREDEDDLINAEFESIVAGLSLDESFPTNYLDNLDRDESEDHFQIPNPKWRPFSDPIKGRAIFAMIFGPLYALAAQLLTFNPLGIEPWPGILAFIGGLATFLYRLSDDEGQDDGAIL